MTISTITFVSIIIALVTTTIVPIIFLIILGVNKKLSFIPFLVGIGSFFVTQVVLRIPILQVLSTQTWYRNFATEFFILYAFLIGGLTAGLFEESGRLIGGKLLRKRTTFKDAVSFGLGHGLCEVFFIFVTTYINNLIYSIMINNGTFDVIAKALPAGQADYIVKTLSTLPTVQIHLAIFERVCAVIFHVTMTVVVFQGIRKKKIIYYFVAILLHTALDSIFVIVGNYSNLYWAEFVGLVFALAGLFYIRIASVSEKAAIQEQQYEAINEDVNIDVSPTESSGPEM